MFILYSSLLVVISLSFIEYAFSSSFALVLNAKIDSFYILKQKLLIIKPNLILLYY